MRASILALLGLSTVSSSIVTSCLNLDCEPDNAQDGDYCPPTATGAKGKGWCCVNGSWRDGLDGINGERDSTLEAAQCSRLASGSGEGAAAVPARTVTSTVSVGKNKVGGSKSEIRWKFNCGGADLQNNGEMGMAPYESEITAPACTTCTVSMKDTFGDGW